MVITFTGNRIITFVYDASGAKLRKITNNNGTVDTYDYVNGVEYKNNVLQRIAHTEGSVSRQDNGTYLNEYVLRDHLGNTRVTFSDADNDGTIVSTDIKQINHYYPFGMNMEGNFNGTGGKNKYQYNNKEWNDDFGLGWNDYGARWYDAAMGRWLAIDPKDEKYSSWSPYNYAKNNPIKFIDPDGKDIILVTKNGAVKLAQETLVRTESGKALWTKYGNSKTDDIYITSQTFVTQTNARGATYKNAHKLSLIKDNKVKIDENDKYQKDFSSLNGIDVSASKGKSIHLISLNEKTFDDKKINDPQFDKYNQASTIFHEMSAHIDINKDQPVDAKKEHELYGAEHFQGLNGEWPTAGSPAESIRMELIELRETDGLDKEKTKKTNEVKNENKKQDEKN